MDPFKPQLPYNPGTIRRGTLGGTRQLKGMAGGNGTANGWEEICRSTDVTAGDPVTREGGDSDAQTHTIFSAQVMVESEETLPPPRVLLRIETADGNDAGAAKTVMLANVGAPVTVSGSYVVVSAQIFLDELGLVQAGPHVVATVAAFISVGDGEDIQPTRWVVPKLPLQFAQQATLGFSRMRSMQGFNAGAATEYLMVFDFPGPNPPPVGTAPLFAFPVPAGDYFSDDFIESARVFVWGINWACSSTPDFLTVDAAALMRVDIELYAEQEFDGTI